MKIRKTATVLILTAVIAVTACAQNYDNESSFVVKPIDGGKGVEITNYIGTKWEINIPPKIKNLPVTSIGKQAFANGKDIISITIPNSVTSIGDGAFWNCTNLNSIIIPSNVTDIEMTAFYGTTSLTAINVASGNKTYASQDGVLYDKNKKTLILYPRGKTASSFTIPNGVTTIGDNAFYNCKLTSVIIPNSVTSIGLSAFGDSGLTSITIPDSVTSIGGGAFGEKNKDLISSVTFQGTIASDKLGTELGGNFYSPFNGDLRDKYLAGGKGTYIVAERDVYGFAETWTKQ